MKKGLIGLGIIGGLFTIAYILNKIRHDKKFQEKQWRNRINKGYKRV